MPITVGMGPFISPFNSGFIDDPFDISTASGGSRPGNQWFAATTGNATNPGTLASPWDLPTALAGGFPANVVKPGDTVFVRVGTYVGLWTCSLLGTGSRPITFKAYNKERVTFDGYVATTLTAAIDNVQTSIPIAKLNVPDNTTIDIDTETIRIHTAYSGGSYTGCDRGWNGTTAASHLINAQVLTESGSCIVMAGNNLRFVEIECTVSTSRFTNRVNPQTGSNPFGRPAGGIDIRGAGNRAINCIVHDCTDGISTANVVADNFEIHGCLSYYSGWDASDRGHGHNYYIHNDNPSTSVATLGCNVSLTAFDLNAQIFTGGGTLGNVQIDRFIGAQSGVLSSFGNVTDLLFGVPGFPISNSSITNSAIYDSGVNGFAIDWGSGGGTDFGTFTGNYAAGQNTAVVWHTSTNVVAQGNNTIVGPSSVPAGSPPNTVVAWKPGSGKVFFYFKNNYEAGRANIAVYNWDGSTSVNLDFSSFMNNGDAYDIRNAWDFFGTSLGTGTWSGTPVAVTISALNRSTPVGLASPPAATSPEFCCFIVRKTN
jgi:hypothetical protein